MPVVSMQALKDVNIVIVRNLDFDLLIGPALSSGND
jgi:hypothetical protein